MSLQQIKASDPSSSIWVSASAGTGKTKILTDRVIRLLLTGTALNKILCLTFTNAAANEMKERIISTMFRWSILPTEDLALELEKTQGTHASRNQLLLAASLYEQYLRSENSLNVQTIHSFCQKLLKQFPLEAGVSPNFQIIDEIKEQALLNEIKTTIIRHPNLEIIAKYLITNFHELIIEEIFNEIIQNKHLFAQHNIDPELNVTELSKQLIIQLSTPIEEYFTEFTTHQLLQNILESNATFAQIRDLFLTTQGTMRKHIGKNLKKDQILYEKLLELQTKFYQKIQDVKNQQLQCFSQVIELLSRFLISEYNNIKAKKALLDYDDLIEKSCILLSNSDAKEWVLYKLDGFIDHLLVDEAQDTSASQWKVINSLSTEFYSGEGSNKIDRTIFVVGDAKQSIFSFQGAELDIFIETNLKLAEKIYYANKKFSNIDLEISYRSGQEILDVVYAVFCSQQKIAPYSFAMPIYNLAAFRKNLKSSVELWPLCKASTKEKNFWPIKENPQSENIQITLANKIASYIKTLIDSKIILSSTQKVVRLQDIMILFRKRDQLVKQVIKALEEHDLSVSGLDRIHLKENMAVQDLLSIARFVINPDDDLNLASLLKSPIIGVTEEELHHLAVNRTGSLWQSLESYGAKYQDLHRKLLDFQNLYIQTNILEFFQYITDFMGYRTLLTAQSENSSDDAINELLYICENYMIQNSNSMQKFLLWLDSINSSIKRENLGEEQIRIMTVHGAKGLQAPIVIMCDTTSMPSNNNRFFWTENKQLIASKHSEDNSEYLQELKNEAKKLSYAEYLRLLYVAMTRAQEKLVICGYQAAKTISDECWYAIINQTMQQLACAQEDGSLIYGNNEINNIATATVDPSSKQNIINFYPEMLHHNFTINSLSNNSVIPPLFQELNLEINGEPAQMILRSEHMQGAHAICKNQFLKDGQYTSSTTPLTPDNPLEYGLIFHKILEDSISSKRLDKMQDHPFIKSLPSVEQTRILHNIEKVQANLEFRELLKLENFTEINIGTLTTQNSIELKRVDLMICDGERVIIIDYKSDMRPALNINNVPPTYIEQLAHYKKICQLIYPSKQIITKILWLENGNLMDISS